MQKDADLFTETRFKKIAPFTARRRRYQSAIGRHFLRFDGRQLKNKTVYRRYERDEVIQPAARIYNLKKDHKPCFPHFKINSNFPIVILVVID